MIVEDEWDDDYTGNSPSIEVHTAGFEQPAGFVWLKETPMDPMNPQDVERMRKAANIASAMEDVMPEIEKMQQSTMTKVFLQIGKGELTPEEALSYWYEMYSYHRLGTRLRSEAKMAEQITDRR